MSIFDRPGLLGQDQYRGLFAEQNARPQIWPRVITAPQLNAGITPPETSGSVPGISNAPSPMGGPVGPGPDQAPVDAGISTAETFGGFLAETAPIALGFFGPTAAITAARAIANAIAANNRAADISKPGGFGGPGEVGGGFGGQGFGGADVSGGAVGAVGGPAGPGAGPGSEVGFSDRGIEGMASGLGTNEVGIGQTGNETGFDPGDGAGGGEGTK